MTTQLFQAVKDKIEVCYLHAEEQLKRSFPRPDITFNQTGKAAGSARLQQNQLRFNKILLQENQQHFIQQTVPHEIAHLLVYQLYGRTKPHGKEWQNMMLGVFNRPAQTTHDYDVTNINRMTYSYQCQCSQHQLTIRRHNKIQRGQAQYSCKSCRQVLIPTSKYNPV